MIRFELISFATVAMSLSVTLFVSGNNTTTHVHHELNTQPVSSLPCKLLLIYYRPYANLITFSVGPSTKLLVMSIGVNYEIVRWLAQHWLI